MSTYEPIMSTTLESNLTTVEFTGIANTYDDLIITAFILPTDTSYPSLQLQFGGSSYDTGGNYQNTQLNGNGSSPVSNHQTNNTYLTLSRNPGIGNVVGVPYFGRFHLMGYSRTNTYKFVLAESSAPSMGVSREGGLWKSNSAIERIKIYVGGGSFGAGSKFSIFGIKAA